MTRRRDELYSDKDIAPGSFRFDETVVEVFPDMIDRSVPGYGLIVPMIGQLARRYVKPKTRVHDLGASLGAVSFAVRDALEHREDLEHVALVATDNSEAMSTALEKRVAASPGRLPITVNRSDLRDVDFRNSSLVVLNFTLQFLELADRDRLLKDIAGGLVDGGALILAEKIAFPDAAEQARQTEWHHDYKRLQGYSDLEIARKRTALEQVLLSEAEADHLQRLKCAGFRRTLRWFQCFGFCAYLAEK